MATYPTLADGCVAQIPYVRKGVFLTAGLDSETGWRFSYSWRANPLYTWELLYSQLPDADLATLRAFFEARYGSYEEFEFVDPEDGVTHTKCRFGMDAFSMRHLGPNQHSVTVIIQEYA